MIAQRDAGTGKSIISEDKLIIFIIREKKMEFVMKIGDYNSIFRE